ncbi:MAG: tyrosine-type recombinase/integrase [Alteromonadaceae bacterium]|nr:tyrosine-type recombinase/integrase [Alteromonadaceae bacterium]
MLTDRQLKSWTKNPPEKTQEISVGNRLYARVTDKGTISFQFRYRIGGRNTRITLGSYPLLALKSARDEATRLSVVLQEGGDPKVAARSRYSGGEWTLDKCIDEWLNKHVARKLKDSTRVNYSSIAEKHLKGRYSIPVERIRMDEWLSLFDGIAEKTSPYNAGVVLKVTKRALGWCMRRELINQPTVMNLEVSTVGTGNSRRDRTLELHEIGRIWMAIENTKLSLAVRNSIKLLLLTGARNSEVREAKWNEFDFENRIWTLPKERSKSGVAIRRALTDEMIQLVNAMRATPSPTYVFGSMDNDFQKPITTHAIQRAVRRLRAKLKMDDWRVHDFRRSLATRLSEQGIQPHIVEKILGHSLGGVLAVYNRHDWIDKQNEAYEIWYQLVIAAAEQAAGNITAVQQTS